MSQFEVTKHKNKGHFNKRSSELAFGIKRKETASQSLLRAIFSEQAPDVIPDEGAVYLLNPDGRIICKCYRRDDANLMRDRFNSFFRLGKYKRYTVDIGG